MYRIEFYKSLPTSFYIFYKVSFCVKSHRKMHRKYKYKSLVHYSFCTQEMNKQEKNVSITIRT